MKYDVFISYSSKDQKVVEAMCAYLEQHKVRCFVAYRDIPKGVVWAKAIVDALDESKMMVVVFSEEFNLSDQVDREIELASEDRKPILTFRISDAMFKGAKKYYLKNINWIDAFPHPERVFDTLLGNICRLLGKPSMLVQTPKPVERTWKVGDYYNVDGKEGVVFWVDETGKHGKIVSLDEGRLLYWTTYEEYIGRKCIIGASDEHDGMKNQNIIMKMSDWKNKFPAFAWCANHGNGWYLPAIEELKELYLNDAVYKCVNASLIARDATTLADKKVYGSVCYWSSTERRGYKDALIATKFSTTYESWWGDWRNGNSGSNVRAVSTF